MSWKNVHLPLLFSLQRLLLNCIISADKDRDMAENLLEHGGPALVLNQNPEKRKR